MIRQLPEFKEAMLEVLHGARIQLSDLLPSEWAEAHRVLSPDITPFPGPYTFNHTPYWREVVDRLSPYDPATDINVMSGSQIGKSTGVIENGLGWIISESPGPILFLTGHIDLTDDAMNKKVDQMIDSCGLRHLIKPSIVKKKNQRTGDTSRGKEFPGGSLRAGTASNHKLLRQISVKYGFLDDYESVKNSSEQSGDTDNLIMRRFAAYRNQRKVFRISTPERKETSNIEPAFLAGDQRRYHVPCPCCASMIVLYWTVSMTHPKHKDDKGGITWKLDEHGKVIKGSVGYVCQDCGDFFDDSHKKEMLLAGRWIPTAEPKRIGIYSYHISSLYAPPGHETWEDYVNEFLEANPPGGKRREKAHQTFLNTILGETYEATGAAPEATRLMKNQRDYKVGVVPEWKSNKDGNGSIVMLTCACDLNGTEKDARLDYEVVAWSETGSSYSVTHGSIGTFVPREGAMKEKEDRLKWTYEHKKANSVWPELEKVLSATYPTDTDRKMKIVITGVDTGHYTTHAYSFIEKTNKMVVGIKGDKEGKYRKYGVDMPNFKVSKERTDLYLLDVTHIKDEIAELMEMDWAGPGTGELQPPGFMNYPASGDGKYQFNNFFGHYEAEHRVDDYKDGEIVGQKWTKKSNADQNHFWDVYVYNYCLKDIWAAKVLKESPMKRGNWADFVDWQLKRRKKVG